MKQKVYSAATIARWTRLTRQAVSKAFRAPPRSEAKVGRRGIDVGHPEAVAWLEQQGVEPEIIDPTTPGATSSDLQQKLGDSVTVPLESLLDHTLREVVVDHGSPDNFVVWIRARRDLAAARRQEVLLDETQGRLISRELVQQSVLAYLDSLNRRLLKDAATTIATKLPSLVRTETKPTEIAQEVRGVISTYLKRAVDETARKIRGH